jgi:hypothetical protein
MDEIVETKKETGLVETTPVEVVVVETLDAALIKCVKCGQMKPPHKTDRHLCVECSRAESVRATYYRQHQGDWIAEAKEQGILPWLQQPGETQWEYSVWLAYRDSYPGKKPSISSVAEKLMTSYSAVKQIAQRWTFPVRLQLWIAECDRVTLEQRRREILDMNKSHIDMAAKLRAKLDAAIDAINPLALKPNELSNLMKMSAELERKARIDSIAQEEIRRELVVDNDNPDLKKVQTKQGDLPEILQILLKTGALGSITTIGIKETKEVVVHDANAVQGGVIDAG